MVVYSIPETVFMAVYNYLQSKPFNEVNQIVSALNSSVTRVDVPAEAAAAPPREEGKKDEEGA